MLFSNNNTGTSSLFTAGFMAHCLCVCLMVFKGVKCFKLSCVEPFPTKVKTVQHPSSAGLCLLFYPIYGWLEFFSQLLSLINTLLPLEFIYHAERKTVVLKKSPMSGAWLYKIILIFPVDEPVECMYLFEFPPFICIYLYKHVYIHTAFPV